MDKITGTNSARRALENGDIRIGTILTDASGIYRIISIDEHSDIVCEAAELDWGFDDFTETGTVHRWTIGDLIGKEGM